MENIKIFALGGLDENGKNLYCLEFDEKIFVVDCGIKRPDDNQYGVDYIICDYDYLEKNRKKIAGVIITHFHDDIAFGLTSLANLIDVEVYAPEFVSLFIKKSLEDRNINNFKLHILPRYGTTKIANVDVTTFGLTHASSDAIGVAIDTKYGSVVFAQQFVIDFDVKNPHQQCDINAIAEIGKKGVFCALIESSYSDVTGYTAPRHRITNTIRPIFEDAEGRILVTIYRQNFFRLDEIIKLAIEFKRKIYVYDNRLMEYIKIMNENGYCDYPNGLFISNSAFNNDFDNVVIFVSENGGNVFKKMHKIAIGEDEVIELKNTDTVLIGSPVVSGTEKEASAMENELYRDNVIVSKLDKKQVLSMHPSIEDIKMMLYLLKPKYFIPIMGFYRDFVNSANIAVEVGFTPDRIVILDNGQIAEFNNGKLHNCSNQLEKIGDILIGSNDDKNIASHVLKDRETLASDGAIVIGIAIDFNNKQIIGGPDIQSRGVIYVKDGEYLFKNIAKMVIETIETRVEEKKYNNMDVRSEIREKIAYYVQRETGKHPMILPAIIEINLPKEYYDEQ